MAPAGLLGSVPFAVPLDTSSTVPEYPLVSRALMLPGGSTDAVLEDLNGNGMTDLAVAVSDPDMLSVFFRQDDGTFLSWPSRNVSLSGTPIALGVVDRHEDGHPEVVVLMKKTPAYDFDHFVRVNTTTWTTTTPRTVQDGAAGLVIGNLSGTSSQDIAVVSEGENPSVDDGIVEVFKGPTYLSYYQVVAGRGASSIVSGDFNNDGSLDIAVSNMNDGTIHVFLSPLSGGMAPSWTLDVPGDPVWLASGDLSSDSHTDLVVACQAPSSLQFFIQSSNQLPDTNTTYVNLPVQPSRVVPGDMNADGRTDLLISSESACRVLGFYQGTSPLWSAAPSFSFPSGAVPRGALVGDLTGDGLPDIGLTSARVDWSGSSMAVYPSRSVFSNSNRTVWTDASHPASLIASGDLNGDGLEDLVFAVPSENGFGYMLGFSGVTNIVNVGFAPERLVIADIDGDGLSDVITANSTHNHTWVHFGKAGLPSASMAPIKMNCSGNVTDVAVGDLDDDGLMDVVVATANGTVEVFFNTGSVPAFAQPHVITVNDGASARSLTVGDFNSDGKDDLAYTNSTPYIDILLQKDSDDPMSLPADHKLQASSGPLSMLWSGDITGDGRDDLVVMKSSGERLYLFDQEGFDDLTPYDSIVLPEPPSFISVMDVTDDERADLLVMFPSADLLFLYKQSGTSLPATPSMTFVTGAYPAHAALGDATGNGERDLLVLDTMSNSVSAWERIILDVGPTARFVLSEPSPEEGVPFSFIDESTSYEGISSWVWTLTYPDQSTETWELDAEAMAQVEFVIGDGEYSMRLDVREPDGDSDAYVLDFTVLEMAPSVTLTLSPPGGIYVEFQTITFVAEVESYDPIVLYEWAFDSPDDGFVPDRETEEGETTHSYGRVGNYTAKVRVTDSDGSSAVQSVQVGILDASLSGTFGEYVVVTRDPNATYVITFDARALAQAYPDIVSTVWEFGDGTVMMVAGPPAETVTHTYVPVRDYRVNLTAADDDGNYLLLTRTLPLVEPTIELISPVDGSVVKPGTSIRLAITDDSPPLVSIHYSVNGGEPKDFETLYSISTADWPDGVYAIDVTAEDRDGNIACKTVLTVTIDDTPPVLTILWDGSAAFGGDKMNVTVHVDDANVASGAVVLFVTFPGDDSSSQFLMRPAGDGVYYALVEVPKRKGTLEFYIHVEDMAGNHATSETCSVDVDLRFIDASWPYLLLIAVLAALGTGAYFLREARIAVDETFVIYRDGRMLAHSTRRLKPGMDDQVLSGMFVAIQDFVRDSFKDETSFTLRKLDFGDKSVLVEKGRHIYLAVILHGKVSRKVARRMKHVVDGIEGQFAEHLPDWDGDLDKVRGVNERVKKLYSRAPILPEAFTRMLR